MAVRQSGSHVRLVSGTKRVTVPLHNALAIGTLKSVLHQAGLTIQELLDSL